MQHKRPFSDVQEESDAKRTKTSSPVITDELYDTVPLGDYTRIVKCDTGTHVLKRFWYRPPMDTAELLREVEAMKKFDSTFVAQVLDCKLGGNHMDVLMKHYEGNLRSLHGNVDSLVLIRECFLSLHYLHSQGIVHGRLLPERFLIDRDDSREFRLVLSGFGLPALRQSHAHYLLNRAASNCGLVESSTLYATPEQCSACENGDVVIQDVSADIFAMGVILVGCSRVQSPIGRPATIRRLVT